MKPLRMMVNNVFVSSLRFLSNCKCLKPSPRTLNILLCENTTNTYRISLLFTLYLLYQTIVTLKTLGILIKKNTYLLYITLPDNRTSENDMNTYKIALIFTLYS